MKLIKKNNKKGFTLIELVIVIAILAILALILVPAIGKYIGNANDAKNQASARTIYTNAVLAMSTSKDKDYKDVDQATAELSNIDATAVEIYHEGPNVTSIKYIHGTGAEDHTFFDGKSFDKIASPGKQVPDATATPQSED